MRGVERVIAAGWVGEKGWVLDAEPTNNRIRGSHKGRTWFKITVNGITAHASTPWGRCRCHCRHGYRYQ